MNVLLHEFRQALRGSIAQPGFSLLVVVFWPWEWPA